MPRIDFMAITATYNGEPYLTLMPVTATAGQFAAGNMSVGLGPSGRGGERRQECAEVTALAADFPCSGVDTKSQRGLRDAVRRGGMAPLPPALDHFCPCSTR